jgi:Putative prokaryotic signal transducing protein
MTDPGWDLEKLVTVGTFAAPWEARLALARLESEGIEAVVADENVGSLYGWGVVGGVKLRVREDEAARAAEVLASESPIPRIYLVTEEDALEPRCPTCRSEDISFERWSWRGFVGFWLLLGFPLPIPSRRWTCRHCGAVWRDEEAETEEGAAEPDLVDLVTVARFSAPWEAYLARTLLASQGIEACVMEERFPPLDLLSGQLLALNRLAVHPDDAVRALEALAAVELSNGAAGISASES